MKEFKYHQIVDKINEMLTSFEDGQRLPAEPEMVKQFGVSRNTIRRALWEFENQGKLIRKQGLGTFYSKNNHKRLRKTGRIGVVNFYFPVGIYPDVIHGIDDELHNNSFAMQMSNSRLSFAKELQVLESALELDIDGLIYEPSHNAAFSQILFAEKTRELLQSLQIPVVTTHCRLPDFPFSSVCVNNKQAGRQAAEYLYAKGHRNTAICYHNNSQAAVGRLESFVQFFEEKGMIFDERSKYSFSEEDDLEKSIPPLAEKILNNRHTAVFAFNDDLAIRLMREFRNKGYNIPEDISIIGFDNAREGEFTTPALTTFSHPGERLGNWAARLLMNQILNPEDPPAHIKISGSFIERDSVMDISKR